MGDPGNLGKAGRRALWLGMLGYALFWGAVASHEGKALFGHPGAFAPGILGAVAFLAFAGAMVLSFSGYREDDPGARKLRLSIVAFCLPPVACLIGAPLGYIGLVPVIVLVPIGLVAAPILAVLAAFSGARPWWAILLTSLPAIFTILLAVAWVIFVHAVAQGH